MNLLVTGGSGRLGRALRDHFPRAHFPPRDQLDLLNPESVNACLDELAPTVVLHAAAFTDVAGAQREPERCHRVNVGGSALMAKEVARRGLFLIHISTDYVFEGSRGNYQEDEPLGPAINHYAQSKIEAERVVRASGARHLVIRTSFRSSPWPHPVAFIDAYTSQDYLDVIAPMLVDVIRRAPDLPYSTLHLGTERKSFFELARRRDPQVEPAHRAEAPVALPYDVSLNLERWQRLRDGF